jgi:tellurite resistance protein TerC
MWLLFAGIVLVSLAVDLLAHRGGHGHSRRSAVAWSIVWVAVALVFAGYVWYALGGYAAGTFMSAYLMEKSLSIDNLFVFMVIFSRLKIPPTEQHRVLFWGIMGALVARGLFIAGGTALLTRWHDVTYLLGAFLIYTGYKTARTQPGPREGESRVLSFLRRHMRISARLYGHSFFGREDGKLVATPLLLALLTIEASDVMFAIDSVPAVFAITEEPFIVYSSNVFAILGLRALYLVLADLLRDLRYLHFGLAAILALAGAKMIAAQHFHVPHYVSLGAIVTILTVSIVASVLAKSARDDEAGAHDAR